MKGFTLLFAETAQKIWIGGLARKSFSFFRILGCVCFLSLGVVPVVVLCCSAREPRGDIRAAGRAGPEPGAARLHLQNTRVCPALSLLCLRCPVILFDLHQFRCLAVVVSFMFSEVRHQSPLCLAQRESPAAAWTACAGLRPESRCVGLALRVCNLRFVCERSSLCSVFMVRSYFSHRSVLVCPWCMLPLPVS